MKKSFFTDSVSTILQLVVAVFAVPRRLNFPFYSSGNAFQHGLQTQPMLARVQYTEPSFGIQTQANSTEISNKNGTECWNYEDECVLLQLWADNLFILNIICHSCQKRVTPPGFRHGMLDH